MDLITFLAAVLLLVCSTVYVVKLVRFNARRARLVDVYPGPRSVPLLGTAYEQLGLSREELFKMMDTHARQYQPIYRTWAGPVPEIHLMYPEHIEVILSSTTHINKAWFYSFFHEWLGLGLLTSTGSRWQSRRKLITPTFHFKVLEFFIQVFADKSDILIQNLKKEADGRVFDIFPYIALCALDIICETAMGTTVNAQEEKESEYVKAIYETSKTIFDRILKPWIYQDFIFYMTPSGKNFKRSLNVIHSFTKKVIQERKAELAKKTTEGDVKTDDVGIKKKMVFLDLLLEASDNGKLLSDEDLREEVDTFMFEGHDTTSSGIGWALFLLGCHLDVQEKVFQELDEIFQGSNRRPTMKDLQEMKYLERVIKETLRIRPTVPFIARSLKEDVQIEGRTIPAGCTVWFHIYNTHRLEKYWSNPEKFNPDNFLPERIQSRHPYAFIPFSAGSRNCVGQKFAMLEEKTVISSILRNYKIKSLEKMEDVKLRGELILRPVSGFQVTLECRH